MLYTIVLDGNIIAASEDLDYIKSYLYETLEDSNGYEFFKVKNEDKKSLYYAGTGFQSNLI